MDCQTNGIHPIVMVNALNILIRHFAREIVKEAKGAVGENEILQGQYIDRLTKKYMGGDPGDLKLDDLNQLN